jgi:predicted esterase
MEPSWRGRLAPGPALCYHSPTFIDCGLFSSEVFVMHLHRTLRIVVALVTLLQPAFVLAQALPNINLLRVRYNSAKTAAKPEGDLKTEIDQIDKALAEATRAGRTGEQRRLFAKGLALLAGRPWSDADDFQASLVLRTTAVVIDSSRPQVVRLEQIYTPSIALSKPLTAVATIAPPPPATAAGASAPAPPPATELGRFEGVSRDLRESPLAMDLDFSKVPDGLQVLSVEVKDGDQSIGTATLRVALRKGLDQRLRQLETEAAAASAEVRADLRYPADYVRKINRGDVELTGFDIGAELTAAESIGAVAKGGKNPFAGKTGGFERHYLLDGANEIMPYRVYVPSSYNGSRAFPLIVALHGLGANEDSFMDSYAKTVPALAEARGYIVVAPLGYRVDGFYGFSLPSDSSPADKRRVELSERDVMEVLKRMRVDYKVDDARIYLMGHSMGAIGTWAIGAKYPAIWAALAAFSGLGNPATVEAMKQIPEFVVHGDADPTVSVNGSRAMVAAMKKLGVDHQYIEVLGGNHIDVVVPNLKAAFDFFDSKRKATTSTQQ